MTQLYRAHFYFVFAVALVFAGPLLSLGPASADPIAEADFLALPVDEVGERGVSLYAVHDRGAYLEITLLGPGTSYLGTIISEQSWPIEHAQLRPGPRLAALPPAARDALLTAVRQDITALLPVALVR
jgi:hypothetical protein